MKTLLAILSVIPGLKATPPLPPRTVDTSSYSDFETTLVEKHTDKDEQYYKVNVKIRVKAISIGLAYFLTIGRFRIERS